MGLHLVALLASVLVQAGPGSDGTQDRADLAGHITTWYRVLEGRHAVGYLHETLDRIPSPGRFKYEMEGEVQLKGRDRAHDFDFSTLAYLDDSLGITEFASEAHRDDLASSLWVSSAGDEYRVEARPLGRPEALAWGMPAKDDVHGVPALTLYALRQNESLGKPGRFTLRTPDPSGQEKAGVEVVIEVGPAVRREYLGKTVWAVPVNFLRPFPAVSRDLELRSAFVDRYGRVLEGALAGGARIVIASDRSAALEGLSAVQRHGRRDPFDKMVAMRNSDLERARNLEGLSLPAPSLVTLDTLDSDLADVRKLLDQVRSLKADGATEEARQGYLKALVQLRAIRTLAQARRPELLPAVSQMRDEAERCWEGAAQVRDQAGRVFASIGAQVERLDLAALEQSRKELEAYRDRIEVEGRPEWTPIAQWVADAEVQLVKSRTRLELAHASLVVTGITIGELETKKDIDLRTNVFGQTVGEVREVSVVLPFAVAEINGKTYRKGDTIEGTQIRIEHISRFSVQFALRDEVREVGLHH